MYVKEGESVIKAEPCYRISKCMRRRWRRRRNKLGEKDLWDHESDLTFICFNNNNNNDEDRRGEEKASEFPIDYSICNPITYVHTSSVPLHVHFRARLRRRVLCELINIDGQELKAQREGFHSCWAWRVEDSFSLPVPLGLWRIVLFIWCPIHCSALSHTPVTTVWACPAEQPAGVHKKVQKSQPFFFPSLASLAFFVCSCHY